MKILVRNGGRMHVRLVLKTGEVGMKKFLLCLGLLGAVLVPSLIATPANAQATRTWVSGVGDDVNPCSRTAPCKTFAGAISKTAAGGEINCIDAGGFGGVTITKSMVIDCLNVHAGVLVSGTNGITVSAGANDVITLRGLEIIGTVLTPALNGIVFNTGAALHVENCQIREFQATTPFPIGFGILFRPSGISELYVTDTYFTNNGAGSTGGAIMVRPTGTGSAKVTVDLVRANNNVTGFTIDNSQTTSGSNMSVRDSESNGATLTGFSVITTVSSGAAGVLIDRASSNLNATGISVDGSKSVVVLTNSTVAANSGAGLAVSNSGQILSYVNNNVVANSPDGNSTGTVTPK
jgi:hypothetical protein